MAADNDKEPRGPSDRQQEILRFVREWSRRHGYAPTVREIAAALGFHSTSSVAHHIKALEAKGELRREAKRPRAVDARSAPRPAPKRRGGQAPAQWVPLRGSIAAGRPKTIVDLPDAGLMLPPEILGGGTFFGLWVDGDSMLDAGIHNGDVVVVREQRVVENGELVAAMIDDEATVKVFQNRDGCVELVPRNPAYKPISGENATILGKVVCVIQRT